MSFTTRRLRETSPARVIWRQKLLLLLRWSGPVALLLTRLVQERREQHQLERDRMQLLKRMFVMLIAVLCAMLLFAATARALVSVQLLNIGTVAHVAGATLPVDMHGHTNILLLGQGDADHDGVDLTDTVMIASIDAQHTKSIALLSLPRDLWFLRTERMGDGRLNSLYRDYKALLKRQGVDERAASRQAMEELAAEIGRALDMEMHRIIKVDFIGFVQAIDAIGGIEIDVPATLVDTQYPGPHYSYQTFRIEAGLQTIDGETALKYARSRHSTSDFDRSARQQQLLAAMGEQMRAGDMFTKPAVIMELADILQEHMETTLTIREMIALADAGRTMDRSRILSMQLHTNNGLYGTVSQPGGFLYNPPRDQFGGASVLLPVSIPEYPVTWRQIRALVTLFIHERTAYLERASLRIRNAGAPEGSARKIGQELARYGFESTDISNAKQEYSDSFVLAAPENATAQRLSQLLQVPYAPDPSLISPPSSETNNEQRTTNHEITIFLGSSYVFQPLQSSFPAP